MKALLPLALALALVVAYTSATPSHLPTNSAGLTGAKVLRVVPHTKQQLHYLQQLLKNGQFDFWKEPRAIGSPVDIMVKPHREEGLKAFLSIHDMKVAVQISDVGRLVDEQMLQTSMETTRASMDWTKYHTYDEIVEWMKSLVSSYPDLCSIKESGNTFEGRTMYLLTIGKGGTDKPGIFIDGGIHAREWISPATVTYMINELVTNSAYDDIVSNVNFFVMPVINPDGYSYTFTDDRMWRKTRSTTSSPFGCKGADPNRNWDFHWMEVGASSSPCAETYAGASPFSEVEMRNVRDEILRLGSKINVYLTFHSYSQLWMYPWGYTSALPSDWQDLDDLAQDAVRALTAVHGTTYEIGSSTNTIYAAAGGSDDWAKGVGGVKYAYTVELRDQGYYGFLLPANQIIPCGEETFEGVKVVANFLMTNK